MENRFIEFIKYIGDCVLEVIYPHTNNCIICDSYVENKFLCRNCENKIKYCYDPYIIDKNGLKVKIYSVAYYSGIILELIIRLKYKSDFKSGEVLGFLMYKKILKENLNIDYITYVPSTNKSLKKRGYNQSKYLAKIIGDYTKIPIINLLTKNDNAKDQIGLNKEERWKNVKNSFNLKFKENIENKNILLVDDVLTTGATTFYCFKELKKLKINNVFVLTAAKSRV
ncbi:ComF family protein [Clostridium oceanicum]|uniref:ComF family protein n=1 Tax=Clostridium oceanicum TaxID=1543 RepID=A0ABN1JPZ4_9CLOT